MEESRKKFVEFFRYGGCEGAVGSPASAPSIHQQGRIVHRSGLNNENNEN